MPTIPYKIDGKRIPSVTTINARFKIADALTHWAWQCGVDGLNYRDEKNKAGSIGTEVHTLCEEYIKGNEPNVSQDPIVHHCFLQFLDWWKEFSSE